jgi:hypothetical protein
MNCPICKSLNNDKIELFASQFNEQIIECNDCNSLWSIQHDMIDVINDVQEGSFLTARSEDVEESEYSWAV